MSGQWVLDAECAKHSPAVFDTDHADGDAAKLICGACPVAGECLSAALSREGLHRVGNRWGVYGGLSPAERTELAFRNERDRRNARRRKVTA